MFSDFVYTLIRNLILLERERLTVIGRKKNRKIVLKEDTTAHSLSFLHAIFDICE